MTAQRIETCPRRKRRVARVVARTPMTAAVRAAERRWPRLRIFNYHSVPERYATRFERQVDRLSQRYDFTDPRELESIVARGPGDRPAALMTFDDGLANHAETAAPILERRGIRAVFCIPAGFPELDPSEVPAWYRDRMYPLPTELHEPEDVVPITWPQVRELAARGHRICSHGFGHLRLDAHTPREVLRREIVESRAELERRLEIPVDSFCWPIAFDPRAVEAAALVAETYAYAFVNAPSPIGAGHDPQQLNRTNLEASWPDDVVDLQMSGVIDLLFVARRVRDRLTSVGTRRGEAAPTRAAH